MQVSDEQGDSTQRVNLVQATQSIQGSFDNIEVMPPRNGDVKSADGRCVDYFVGSEDRNSNSLSVLVAAKPSKCESQRFSPWVYVGVTVGIIGILVVALGVLIVVRDTAQRWARIVAVADDEAIY